MEYVHRENAPIFYFIDGPPFVSSETLHYGHLLVSIIKSTILHYKYMMGYNITNTVGYDCHGLPMEMHMNEILGIKTLKDINTFGMEKYIMECKQFIKRCESSWIPIYKSIGRVVSETDSYRTVDETFMRTTWRIFKQLWNKGLVTRNYRVVPYSIACSSSLSNFEASQNFKETTDIAVYWGFLGTDKCIYVVWTTTPWTLPANHAICVNPDMDYCFVKHDDKTYCLANDCLERFMSASKWTVSNVSTVSIIKGKDLVGREYIGYDDINHIIVADAYVNALTGSGLVHIAPEFGEDDLRIAQEKLISWRPGYINHDGIIQWGAHSGKSVLGTIQKISEHALVRETYKHNYPFCWRTDTPLIYRAIDSWFVSVSAVRDKLVEYNRRVTWLPEHIGTHRFHEWLSTARDWNISRNRVFGTPIPVWISDDGDTYVPDESEITGDLHKHSVDSIEFQRNGKIYKRIPDIFDCWYESACVPFVLGYSADLIVEGTDQTRGWFYTMLVLWGLINEDTPYKNVVSCGLILAENGKKMSKRLGNFRNVKELIAENGSDAIRLYLLTSSATLGESFKFCEKDIKKYRGRLVMFKNAVAFWHEFGRERKDFEIESEFDMWIINELALTCKSTKSALENYKVKEATDVALKFIDTLCNWYIRLMRERIRSVGSGVLWNILRIYCEAITPMVPQFAEEMYMSLIGTNVNPLQGNYPILEAKDTTNVANMIAAISVVRELRSGPSRKPIRSVSLALPPLTDDLLELFMSETNTLEVHWNAETHLIDETETPEVMNEYKMRLVKRIVYNERKQLGLRISDKTTIIVEGEELCAFIDKNSSVAYEWFGSIGTGTKLISRITIDIEDIKGVITLYHIDPI